VGIAGISGLFGFRVGSRTAEIAAKEMPAPEVVSQVEPDPLKSAPVESGPSNEEIDAMLAEMADEASPPAPGPPPFGPGGGNQRWDNMPMEQRRLLRKSMFSALAKVDGLEEVGDAIRQGKIDPSQFNLNPEAIADRMEFYAGSMDQQAMEEEVTKTLQNVVDQARKQMK
jgi:hypothetical protein